MEPFHKGEAAGGHVELADPFSEGGPSAVAVTLYRVDHDQERGRVITVSTGAGWPRLWRVRSPTGRR